MAALQGRVQLLHAKVCDLMQTMLRRLPCERHTASNYILHVDHAHTGQEQDEAAIPVVSAKLTFDHVAQIRADQVNFFDLCQVLVQPDPF